MDQNEVLNGTKEHLAYILNALGLTAEVSLEFAPSDDGTTDKYIQATLKGEGLNDLVGFHGKNMESIQNVMSIILSRQFQKDLRLLLEVNDYRERREKYLQDIAERASGEVISTGQNVELPPMKAYERRAIHIALRGREGILTESVGEGEERRIIIKKV